MTIMPLEHIPFTACATGAVGDRVDRGHRRTLTNHATGMSLRVLRSGAETDGALLEFGAQYPAGSAPPPAHRHPNQEERFVVLSGHLRATVNGITRDLHAGDTLTICAGETHSMWNPGAERARVNWQVRPALRTQEFFECVYGLTAEGGLNARGASRLLDLALVLRHFRAEVEVTSPPLVVQRLVFGAIGLVERTLGRGLRSGARTVLRTGTVDAQGHATRTVAAMSHSATPRAFQGLLHRQP